MSLSDLARTGDTAGVAAALAGLDPAQRRAEVAELRALRKELRDSWSGSRDRWTALLVAGAGCLTSPTAAAEWIGSRVFEDRAGWRNPLLVEVIERQPVEWRLVVTARLAERRAPGWGWSEHFPLLEYLVRSTGSPVPATDSFTTQWVRERSRPEPRHRAFGTLPPGPNLHARLTVDPFTPVLARRVFEVPDLAGELEGPWVARDDSERWPAVLARLAADGVLDRTDLIDRCLARLLRGGGRPNEHRIFLTILRALAPTADEYAERARTLLALLAGPSTTAALAQEVLASLDAAGRLDPEVLDEASPTVLFRPEKKLVRAQLGWLDRAARTAPHRAGPAVLAASDAFGHPDRTLQEQALKVAARHLAAAGPAVLPGLRAAAAQLDPAHHRCAAELFGAEVPAEEYRELLPPPPQPRPVPAPIATPAELAEELGAVLAGDTGLVPWERVLDGLVRHAHTDRAALAEALEPVLRAHPHARDLGLIAEAAAGRMTVDRARQVADRSYRHGSFRTAWSTPFDQQTAARLEEAVLRLATRPLPHLLATPTDTTGSIDPVVLVERLAGYAALGTDPGPVDLGQALLRVAPTTDPAVIAAAAALGTPAGDRLAGWLREGGLPRRPTVVRAPSGGRGPDGRRLSTTRRLIDQEAAGAGLPEDAERLLDAPDRHLRRRDVWWTPPAREPWAAILPHHREETAARLMERFASAADLDVRGGADLLPALAEAGGPAGPAIHLALAYALGTRHPEDRTAAVDALLVLAARGDLDGALLGRESAELVALGAVKPNRLTESLRAAADTGAHSTVWSVLAAALPPMLAGEPPRGAGDLLAVAADCARRCTARGPIPEVTALAGRGGSSRAVREAAALREVLAG
ncbi:DUF6493 family protein [Streptomyces sp. NRRL B-24484]|uniref:DUF7824 domain-containing protein n=1 Tax=Streptomyces sp. NRRL B-24484 TaxID=1463833 RepID=UPI0005B94142|nr:DUF6493 family protein [Streptomyces sp. NRRL B-24484]